MIAPTPTSTASRIYDHEFWKHFWHQHQRWHYVAPPALTTAQTPTSTFFNILLTVHLSVILVINQLDAQIIVL